MRRDEAQLVAGAVRRCGGALVVPVVRVEASCVSSLAYTAEASLVGVLIADQRGARWAPLGEPPQDAPSWQAWLAARPGLLAELRDRLEAAR
ncbi:MAG: hypothetical protein AB1689_20725 [Thermodesulfobacteriota bacterium]